MANCAAEKKRKQIQRMKDDETYEEYLKNRENIQKSIEQIPNKRRAVIRKLAMEENTKRTFLVKVTNPKKRTTTAKDEVNICNFYERDEISRQPPGLKDCLSVKIDGQKVKKQKC